MGNRVVVERKHMGYIGTERLIDNNGTTLGYIEGHSMPIGPGRSLVRVRN